MKLITMLVALAPATLGACALLGTPSPFAYDKKGDLLEFNYAWSAEASRNPALVRKLRVDLERSFKQAAAVAETDRARALAAGQAFTGHHYSRRWATAGQSARLLSLDGRLKSSTGAGPSTARADGLLWDRATRAGVRAEDLFGTSNSFDTLVLAPLCARTRTNAPACPARSAVAVIPVDSDRNRRFDRMLVMSSSTATGTEVRVPISATMLAAMKPAYRAGFEVAQPQ